MSADRITQLGYLGLEVSDLERWKAYAADVLELAQPRDFKSLASANFATPAWGPQWRDSSIGL